MKPITIIIIPLIILLLCMAAVLFKKDRISFQTFFVWFLIWLATAFVFIFPDVINIFSDFLGFNNRMLFVFTVTIVVLLVMAFMNFAKNKQNELTLIKLIQHVSLLASSLEEQKEKDTDENRHHHRRVQ